MNTQVLNRIDVEYEQPDEAAAGAVCSTKHAWARVPPEPSQAERAALKDKIRRLLKEKNAVMVSHYYVHPDLQDLAEETGGIVSDSLEMARFGRDHAAQTLVVSGVRFMGETAKILSPEKTVLMPDLDATCSLDLGCPADEFSAFCDQHPDRDQEALAFAPFLRWASDADHDSSPHRATLPVVVSTWTLHVPLSVNTSTERSRSPSLSPGVRGTSWASEIVVHGMTSGVMPSALLAVASLRVAATAGHHSAVAGIGVAGWWNRVHTITGVPAPTSSPSGSATTSTVSSVNARMSP